MRASIWLVLVGCNCRSTLIASRIGLLLSAAHAPVARTGNDNNNKNAVIETNQTNKDDALSYLDHGYKKVFINFMAVAISFCSPRQQQHSRASDTAV